MSSHEKPILSDAVGPSKGPKSFLREQAEAKAQERSLSHPEDLEHLSREQIQQMIHELNVHQIEFEMQNEELRRAQLELDAARARYFDLYELAPVGYVTLSEKGLILEANLTAAALLGVAQQALDRASITQFIAPQDQDIYYLHQKRLLATGDPQKCDLRMLRPDGAQFWAHLTATAAKELDDTRIFRVVIDDITKRKNAEMTLRKSDKALRTAQCLSNLGSWEWTIATGEVYWSEQLCRISGHDPKRPLPSFEDMRPFYTPKSWAQLTAAVDRALHSGESYHLQLDLVRTDKVIRNTVNRGEVDRDTDGKIASLHGTVQDVTEAKRAEELVRIRLLLQEFAEEHSLGEVMAKMLDEAEQITGSLVSSFHLLDATPQAPSLQIWSTRTSKQFCTCEGEGCHAHVDAGVWGDCVRERRAVIHNDYAAIPNKRDLPEGHAPLIRETVVPIFQKGKIAAILAVGNKETDYTADDVAVLVSLANTAWEIAERKRIVEDRQLLRSQLVQAQKMEAVGQLAGGIAHDFNNILAAMLMQVNMLRLEPNSAAELNEALDNLLELTNRAANLTRQLLLLGRRQTMKTAQYDANRIVRELRTLIERLFDDRVTLTLALCDEPLWFEGDAGMIEQAMTNLCVNARDAMANGGQVTISTCPVALDVEAVRGRGAGSPGRFVCLQVSDTGCGIDPLILDHIFEPFFTTKAQGKGIGLGLATVDGIVAKHGGFVDVKSVVGKGSTFSIYLPSTPAANAVEPRRASVGIRGSESILVVEDEPAVRRLVVRCLRDLGYRVTEAANAVEALEIWEQEGGNFDLLFSDMVMPEGLSGLDLCSRLRQTKPGLRTIIASGYSAEIVDDENAAKHEVKFLSKPYDLSSLGMTIRECLETKV